MLSVYYATQVKPKTQQVVDGPCRRRAGATVAHLAQEEPLPVPPFVHQAQLLGLAQLLPKYISAYEH